MSWSVNDWDQDYGGVLPMTGRTPTEVWNAIEEKQRAKADTAKVVTESELYRELVGRCMSIFRNKDNSVADRVAAIETTRKLLRDVADNPELFHNVAQNDERGMA